MRKSCAVFALALVAAQGLADVRSKSDPNVLIVPSRTLPESSFLTQETKAALEAEHERQTQEVPPACGELQSSSAGEAPDIRRCQWEAFYESTFFRRLHERYAVSMFPKIIAGIYTEVFTPTSGVAAENQHRVLINVHGGGFIEGARTASHIESIPFAAVGKIKVISIDYRQAPEQSFPAAMNDTVAVYRELLKAYKPERIGIYGCSAGALLTAETIARLIKEGIPLPGAIAMLCEGAGYWTEGDSGNLKVMLGGIIWTESRNNPYFKHVDPADSLAFPMRSPELLAKFPPTLLIASTRDPALSSVVHTHNLLSNAGVEAELHIWEGHAFMSDPELPPSREVYGVTARFFDRRLSK